MGWWDDASNWTAQNLAGQADPNSLQALLNKVQGPSQASYQIPGMQDYINQSSQNSGEIGQQSADLSGATNSTLAGEQQLQGYNQNIAMGNGETAADQMLRNAQGTAGRQLQSGVASSQSQSPALALRQLLNTQGALQGNIAGQSAQQKLQEQQQYAGIAQRGNDQLYQQQFQRTQQDYVNKVQNVQARQDIANGIFSANRAQGSLNASYDQNRQAFQQFQAQQGMQIEQDRARAHAALAQMLVKGGMAVGTSALGSMLGGAGGSAVKGGMDSGLGDAGGGMPGSFSEGITPFGGAGR